MPARPAGPFADPVTEEHHAAGRPVLVVREDRCCPGIPDAPPLSKLRGIVARVAARPEARIGVVVTGITRNGWAVAAACRALGRRCTVFAPAYRDGRPPSPGTERAAALGADVVGLPAGRQAPMNARAARLLGPAGHLLPAALRLPETAAAVAAVAARVLPPAGPLTVVVPVGAGPHLAGLARALADRPGPPARLVAVLAYAQDEARLRRAVAALAAGPVAPFEVVPSGLPYGRPDPTAVPFPASPLYEAKAWAWLLAARPGGPGPVVFWNIGA
jgi:hypothetical protein